MRALTYFNDDLAKRAAVGSAATIDRQLGPSIFEGRGSSHTSTAAATAAALLWWYRLQDLRTTLKKCQRNLKRFTRRIYYKLSLNFKK